MKRPTRAMSRVALVFVGALVTAVPAITHALGLGNLKVNSALNESLNAEIDFSSISKKELKSLNVTLASRPEFEAAGVERLASLSDIKFTLAKRLDGRSFLQLSSEQPIREPFLHFLLKVEWAGGRLVREFTALIDPPYLVASKPAGIQAPQTAAPRVEPEPPSSPVAAATPSPAPTMTVEPLSPESAVTEPQPAAEPQPVVATAQPEPLASPVEPEPLSVSVEPEPTPVPELAPVEMASTESALLGPPELRESTVSISPETGWPVITEEAGVMTAAADTESGTMVEALPPEGMEPEGMEPTTEPTTVGTFEPTTTTGIGSSWASVMQYEVKRGDTLWGIAEKLRVDSSLTMEQVIMALYEANPDAFFRNNVNNVYAGKILRVPERVEIDSLPGRQARKIFLAQYDEWQEYQVKLASASKPIEVAEAVEEAMEPATGAQTTEPAEGSPIEGKAAEKQQPEEVQVAQMPAAEEESVMQETQSASEQEQPTDGAGTAVLAAKAKPSGDLLKIVRAAIEREGRSQKGELTEGESEQSERLALAERATTLEESLDSAQMQQEELGERVGTVGSQLEKQKRLIELENEALAKTQKPVTAPTQPQPETGTGMSESPPAKQQVAMAETAKTAEQPAPATPPKPKTEPMVAPTTDKAKTKPKKKRIKPPPPAEEKGMLATIQELTDEYLMQAVAGLVVLSGGLLLLVYFRRRRQAEAEFEESILTDTGATTEEPTATTTDSGGEVTTSSASSTSFLSDFSQGGMGNISTDEVDPLAETEVYLAYGRDEQAEEILKEAVTKDPGRHELKVKLLEIYHNRNDVGTFETLAEELYAALEGRGGELWNRVAEMGKRLNPENPMFEGAMVSAQQPAMPPTPALGPLPAEPEPVEPAAPEGLDFEPGGFETPSEVMADEGLELDIAAESEEAPADAKLEFDLDMDSVAEEAAKGPHLGDTAELEGQDLQPADLAEGSALEPVGLGEQPADNVVDFDISQGQAKSDLAAVTDEPVATTDEGAEWDLDAASGLDMSADLEMAAADAAAEALAETPADSETPTDESQQQWDETATKLDLAKAYVDMGDAEGARSILDEVMAEGNDDQKKQAAELAAQIA
ncbi:MAG: FimV/HubP family polar landmark protein [Acidiferrobacterales bacterium]